MTCLGLLILFHCVQPTPPQIDAARFCRTARPITWSSRDTPETVKEIRQHNARGVKICGWKAPPK